VAAVESACRQTFRPVEVLVAIDNNELLLTRAEERWKSTAATLGVPVVVLASTSPSDARALKTHVRAHGSRRRFGAGAARNTAAAVAVGEILAFLDDDAIARPEWLEYLIAPYLQKDVVAVGGAPLPHFETSRPKWFPRDFDWVFGCAYDGLPRSLAPARHLIGASLSVRKVVFDEVGGFHSVDFDDLDLCMRLGSTCAAETILYEPRAIVDHNVPASRVSWRYFWRRAYFVNKEKVAAFQALGEAANLRAEMRFVLRGLTYRMWVGVSEAVHGDLYGLVRCGAALVGMGMAGIGHVAGRTERYLSLASSAR
jgi:GT2 family glycosyltransferase